MEQQEEEYKKEKAILIHAQSRLQNQLKASMERERHIANRFTLYEAEVVTERNQWMEEREEFHNQIEELQAHEEHLSDAVVTTEEWLQKCHENVEEAKGQVLQLTESLIDVYGGHLHRSDESLGRESRALAPHLPKALFKAQEPEYFQYLLSAMGKPFAEAIKIGEMVENGIKSGKIVSQAVIRATTKAIQSGSGDFTNRKKKEEGSMTASGSRGVQMGMNHPYGQVQQEQYNSPQHYYPSQYAVLNTQAYVRPFSRQQWRGPAPQVSRPQQQNFQAPYNPRPRTNYTREQGQKENFTPIGESYTSLLRKLIQLRLVEPVNPYIIKPNARGFDQTVYVIEVRNEEAPNVTNNPFPAHNNERVVGMVDIFEDYEQISRTKVESKVSKEESSMVLEPIQRSPIIVKGARRILESLKEPVVIQIATHLLITNTKAVPWNYNNVVVTHKGKEIIEETNETRGLTRSGRCYAPEELKRDKQIKENQLPMKKPVTEEDAEEFLKKMKAQYYSVIDQLRKTPAQISLLSLLIHSKEHREELTRILNEAHISENITMGHLEKMVNQIFEVNRITFTDDELPLEGPGHNRALHLTVKCEENCAKRDTLGEIYLIVTIGSAEFGITFKVIDMDTSYNLLLGRPWIHMSRVVPSTLHQVVKFEHDKQEIIVHGEDDLPITRDLSIPCIEAKRGCESLNYQALEIITVNQFLEGKPILQPHQSSTSVMVVAQMVQNGYEPGKGLGL
ncbi:uncharacterized protein LOC114074739 [Solanum pennellii]|uniref:Uncharacterized protein LOC114074739 n=1 Tax=Solanum pennellii TaxID=28526 RepID=A0ABM1UYF8_SOLPN|nr:uncharacterized protein LOC114074739 [Solanum pennellii]